MRKSIKRETRAKRKKEAANYCIPGLLDCDVVPLTSLSVLIAALVQNDPIDSCVLTSIQNDWGGGSRSPLVITATRDT